MNVMMMVMGDSRGVRCPAIDSIDGHACINLGNIVNRIQLLFDQTEAFPRRHG